MKRTVIQHPHFFSRIKDDLIDKGKLLEEDFQEFEWKLINDTHQGDVIPGLSGLRKTRLKSTSKGKRSGFRVDYLDIPEKGKLYLLIIYAKNVKPDLTADEKKKLSKVVNQIKEEAKNG
jgi:hypothetical protein